MLATSTRLLRLLSLLQSRRHWPARDLSERLGIDVRTVRRDIDRLRELGYPIHASSGVGGGYSMRAGSTMPPMLLDDDEAVAVAVALRAAAGSVGRMDEAAAGVLAKIDQVMPARLRKRASALHAVTVTLPGASDVPPADLLMQLAGACRDCKRLTLQYKDRGDKESSRRIEPMRLAHTGRRWYLVAWDGERQGWRTFRADRILRAVATGGRFTPRKLPKDVVSFVSQSIAWEPFRYRVRLKLRGSAAQHARSIPSWTGVVEPLDENSCTLSIGAPAPESLVALMVLAGVDFEVIDAPALAELRKVAERLMRGMS